MYCDLEAMITKEVKVNRVKIQNKSVHVPIAVGTITVCRPKKEFGSPPMIYMGADCVRSNLTIHRSDTPFIIWQPICRPHLLERVHKPICILL